MFGAVPFNLLDNMTKIPVFFHPNQLEFKPLYEWAFGEKIDHPETTARAESILRAVQRDSAFEVRQPRSIPFDSLRELHNFNLFTLYATAQTNLEEGETFSPMVFPRERDGSGDPTNLNQTGAFCFDSGTPLCHNTLDAAGWSAGCAYDAADLVATGEAKLAFSLSRPPGHHATHDSFGGYCYFNNAAVAARRLGQHGRVAIIDIDYHHGNGTQALFYGDADTLTISIHANPAEVFPYFVGYAHETGEVDGLGFNSNIIVDKSVDGKHYLELLDEMVKPALDAYAPDFLVIAAGFDTYYKDPVGGFELVMDDYHPLGRWFGQLELPTVVVQEGGYFAPDLGDMAVEFLRGVND